MHENKLILGDALYTLKELSDNSVDMIFTDPPYNTTNLKIDKVNFDLSIFLSEFQRILKPNGWIFSFSPLGFFTLFEKYFKFKFQYIWEKFSPIVTFYNYVGPMPQHENIFAFYQKNLKKVNDLYWDKIPLRTKGDPYKIKRGENNSEYRKSQRYTYSTITTNTGYREGTTILKYPNKFTMSKTERTSHPTQKSLALCESICKAYCPENGIVLDPFMGSGTIPLAARRNNRKYIGCEINPEYYDIAKNRFDYSITSFTD